MFDVIRVLQLGTKNYNDIYYIPDYIELEYSENFTSQPQNVYDLVFVDRQLNDGEIELLKNATKAYTLYVLDDIVLTSSMEVYYKCNMGKRISRADIADFLKYEARNYFAKPYGEKMRIDKFAVSHGFKGSVQWDGYYSINLDGDYGLEFKQIIYLRQNLPMYMGDALELWLEYEKDDSVELEFEITLFKSGEIATELKKWLFSEQDMADLLVIDNDVHMGSLFFSLRAKGSGKLRFIAMHDRISRRGHGCFLPGGMRKVFSNREEIFYYFEPGDMKPPLNVYFSGYKTMEGFEGYYIMKKMGKPFLLIAEPRLEGGAFYMGNEEYEKGMADIIRMNMKKLGFSSDQVIMSGLSMGTFGAIYYACDILPHAVILGKPLVNVGDIAINERLHRPDVFPTSLDVVNYLEGDLDETSLEAVNNKFWMKFNKTQWKDTMFIISYMIEDDYDSKAYYDLMSHMSTSGVLIYGKGLHGRHNDASASIVSWFMTQYDKVIKEYFQEGLDS